jgi:hypothetical protein
MAGVFISYSHSDSSVADQIATVLAELNIEYFRDVKDIKWGDVVTASVREGLTNATAIIVIISPGSLKSHWVSYEVGFATARGKRLLPFLTHPAIDPPTFIADLSYAENLEQVREYFTDWKPTEIDPSATLDEKSLQAQFDRLVEMMPELLSEMKDDLSRKENRFVREFVALESKGVMFNHEKQRFEYYGDSHSQLQNKIDIIESTGFVYVVHVSKYSKIYRMTEEFVSLLLQWRNTT